MSVSVYLSLHLGDIFSPLTHIMTVTKVLEALSLKHSFVHSEVLISCMFINVLLHCGSRLMKFSPG
jgi:hypothetical protein